MLLRVSSDCLHQCNVEWLVLDLCWAPWNPLVTSNHNNLFLCMVLSSVHSVRNSEDCVTAWQNCVFLAWNGKSELCELNYGVRACLRMQNLVQCVIGLCEMSSDKPNGISSPWLWEWLPKLTISKTVWDTFFPGWLIHFRGKPVSKLATQYRSPGDKNQWVRWGPKISDNLDRSTTSMRVRVGQCWVKQKILLHIFIKFDI